MYRRRFVAGSSGATAFSLVAPSVFSPAFAQSPLGWSKDAFEAKSLAEVVKAIGGSGSATESRDVVMQAPEIAADGSLVRISAQTSIVDTMQICFAVEKNPYVLAAVFDIPPGTDASVSTTIKMAQSSNVYAFARVGNKFYYAVKEVRVTLGGCGI
jgi:sulfur-oxidizing protein SoxY